MSSINISGIFWYQHYSDSYVPHFLEQMTQMKFLQDYLQGLSGAELFPVDPHFLCMLKLWLVWGWRGAILTSGSEGDQPDRGVLSPSQQIKSHSGLLLASSSGCNDTSNPWAISFDCTSSASGWLDKGHYIASQSLWWTQFIKGTSYSSLHK